MREFLYLGGLDMELFRYLGYVIETALFTLVWYKWHLGADISLFDNCSWKDYKRHKSSPISPL
jgi:hypothetical protein